VAHKEVIKLSKVASTYLFALERDHRPVSLVLLLGFLILEIAQSEHEVSQGSQKLPVDRGQIK